MRTALVTLTMCLVALPASAKYSGGTGEPNDPYQIATAADLIALSETPEDYDKHFILTTDIDLSRCDGKDGRPAFNVIGDCYTSSNGITTYVKGTPFAGVFDGNGMTISHLTSPKANGDLLGLFGGVARGGVVKNLRVLADINVDVTDGVVGALAGYNGGTVTRCSSEGVVTGKGWMTVGGLVGLNMAGTITDCHSTASVSGGRGVGGLVGWNVHWQGGGVRLRGHVAQCYSAGKVSGELDVGGLVGGNGGEVVGCFWDVQASGQITTDGGTAKTTAEMWTAKTFLDAGWDFVGETVNGTEDVWWIFDGRDYPRLWWERVVEDDFEDGEAGPLWFVYAPEPELVQIKEVNGRLETTASAEAQNVDAFYVSDGWRLDATKDFAIRVDFHFSRQDGHDGRVTLGVVPGLDPSAVQWAELEAGCFDTGPFYLYEVRDGSWVQERVADRFSDDGTLYMSYNSDADELYFSHTGYGKANAWETMPGLLKGRWKSEPVYVILGGGSEGMALTGEDAWLDNLVVNSGTLILSEPADGDAPDEEEPDLDGDRWRFEKTHA